MRKSGNNFFIEVKVDKVLFCGVREVFFIVRYDFVVVGIRVVVGVILWSVCMGVFLRFLFFIVGFVVSYVDVILCFFKVILG